MPQFILNDGGQVALSFTDLDGFTRGYIEAAFFTSAAPGVSSDEWDDPATQEDLRQGRLDGTVPNDTGFGSLSAAALVEIMRDCAAFQHKAEALLTQAYEREGYDNEQAGRDFWYTRNGHGVGYWDREPLAGTADSPDLGDALSELARHDETGLYYQSGLVEVE